MKFLPVCTFFFLAFASHVLANINPYIPVLVVPKSPMIKCPPSCTNARDCFFVHPLSEQHFYSCFHGKAMVHQCPTGKAFSDDKHQCVQRGNFEGQNDITGLSNAKINDLTVKITNFEQLVDKFEAKMEKVQKVIIESDNKIGLLGKFLLKALKSNRENYCTKDGKPAGNAQQSATVNEATKPQEMMIEMDGERGDEEYGIAIGGMGPHDGGVSVVQSPKSSGLNLQHDHQLVDDEVVFGPKTDDSEVEMPVQKENNEEKKDNEQKLTIGGEAAKTS